MASDFFVRPGREIEARPRPGSSWSKAWALSWPTREGDTKWIHIATEDGDAWVEESNVREPQLRRNGRPSFTSNAIHRETTWRRRQIILPDELVRKVDAWHGGQHTAVYALASTGRQDLVSLSMIDAALDDLESDMRLARGKQKTELRHAVNGLTEVRHFWREHSAKEAGLESDPDFRYEYDRKDYGISASEEDAIPTRSG